MSQVGIIKIKKLVDGLLSFIEADYLAKIALNATVAHTVPNGVGVKKKDIVTVTGTSGQLSITDTVGDKMLLEFNSTLSQSCSDFVTEFAADMLLQGVVLTSSSNTLIFEASVAGEDFVSPVVENMASESFLIRCFDDDDVIDGISFKDLAIEIFTRTNLDSRKIDTRLLFDVDRALIPTIHVREPAKGKGKTDAISYIGEEIYENLDGSYNDQRRRSFDSQFELMITSANRHEVLIIEEVLLALLIGAQDTIALSNPFYTFEFSVKELIANNELVPQPLFIKSIGLNVAYSKYYPDLSNNSMLNKILFTQNILSE